MAIETVELTPDTHLKEYKQLSPNGHQSTVNTLEHQPVAEAGHVLDVHSVNSSGLPTSLLEPRQDDKDLTKSPAQETGSSSF